MSKYNEQSGGLWSIDVYLASSVTGWQPVMNDDNAVLLVFPNESITLQIEPDKINLREPVSTNSNGELFNTALSMNTIGLSKEVQQAIDFYNHKDVIVRTTDLEGVKKVYGTHLTPLQFLAQLAPGSTQEQGQGYQISCAGTTLSRGIYL